jgi:hypothetical protein
MKKFLAGAFVVAALVGGSLVAVAPAQALTPSDVASSATTTVSGDCHAGASVTKKVLFPDDTYTVTLTHCNSNWTPNASTWKYGNIWTNVTRGNGGTGVRAPDAYIVTNDQQCIQQNSSNSFVSIPQNLAGFTTQMTDAMTSAITINAYDHDNGQCTTTGNVYRFNQVAYQISPITPTITAAFADASVATSTNTTLTVTLTNTQRYRTGVRGTFSGAGFDIALPTGAILTPASTGTCVGSVSQVSSTFRFTGASLNNSTDSCTVIVPINFASTGTVTLNAASLTASSSNKGALINDLSASITVSNAPTSSIAPATQAPSLTVGELMTPTTAFTPTGFTGTVVYSISTGLPAGLLFDTATGVISGTPTTAQASSNYTVTASDGTNSATATVSIGIASPPPALLPATQTIDAHVGEAIATSVITETTGCTTGMTIAPSLPAGLTFDPTTGVISGTPTEVSPSTAYTITMDCTGGEGAISTATVTLSVGAASAPDLAGLVNTGLALLGPAGVIALLIAIGAPFFFVSERFRKIRSAALVFHKSSHVTITSPATFFDRLRGKN